MSTTQDHQAALQRLLDLCEATWLACIDVPTEMLPDGLQWCLYKFGEVVDEYRPGLLDRLDEREAQRNGGGS